MLACMAPSSARQEQVAPWQSPFVAMTRLFNQVGAEGNRATDVTLLDPFFVHVDPDELSVLERVFDGLPAQRPPGCPSRN
jgi:hypothetical protein